MITYWGTPSESSVSLSRTHVHAHTISFTCGMALLYFEGLVRGPLGNALTIFQRGRRTNKQIWHCRARGDACSQVSQAWRTAASTDSRDRQGPAGTGRDQKPWMVPTPPYHRLGGARKDNRGECLLRRSFQPPPPCLLSLPPPHPSLWRTLNTENLLPCVERCTRHTLCPPNGLRPSNTASLRADVVWGQPGPRCFSALSHVISGSERENPER